jgi:molybdate transport system substrate-binding protein
VLGAALAVACSPRADGPAATVFAAASLETALKAGQELWDRGARGPVALAFAATATLARQIQQGAAADLFIAADPKWIDRLVETDDVRAETRATLTGNRLVLVAPKGAASGLTLAPGVDLAGALGPDGRLAIAEPSAAPAGAYAQAALTALGVWAGLEGRTVRAANVRAALAFVARGEAPFGIVYASDAKAEPAVDVVAAFDANLHPPIRYEAALTRAAGARSVGLMAALKSPEAQALFVEHGFVRL